MTLRPTSEMEGLLLFYHRLRFRLRRAWNQFRYFVYKTLFGGQSIERMPTELRSAWLQRPLLALPVRGLSLSNSSFHI